MKKKALIKHSLTGIVYAMLLTATVPFSSCSDNDDNGDNFPVSLSPYDMNSPVGFGQGITGGNGLNPVTVKTEEALKEALSGTKEASIYVEGHISLKNMISVGSNKTIIGRKGASISNLQRNEKAGIFLLEGSRNIIIRNLTLLGPGAFDIDANNSDNISLVGAVKVWVDHCDIQDGIDGNMDIVNGSDSICVSWTRFRYLIPPMASGSGGNNNHRNSNLIGNSNKNVEQDAGRLNCTFINCWWGEGCSERCPRVRFGKVHVVNSLYNGNDFTYCIGYGVYSNIYAEKCAFTTKNAQDNYLYDWHGDADFNVKVTGCLGVDDVELKQGNQGQFIPTYPYTSYDATLVESVLTDAKTGAGPTLDM